jgi:cytochrome c553
VNQDKRPEEARISFGKFPGFAFLFLAVLFLAPEKSPPVLGSTPSPPLRVPTEVAWTGQTLANISKGDAFRGLLLARRCNHCHGEEGFSAVPLIPNLAGIDDLSFWKQMEDFKSGKRVSPVMQEIAILRSAKDAADLAVYYSMLPTGSDSQDRRSFPQAMPDPSRVPMAIELILFGDGRRGIPPCQACHGPVGSVKGAPSLASQNGDYLLEQLNRFANGERANDINVRMRSIARQLTDQEKTALSEYYGAGLGPVVSPW